MEPSPELEGYHPRSVLLVRAFTPPLQRAQFRGVLAAAVAAALLALFLPRDLPAIARLLMAVIVSVAAGSAVALAATPLRTLRSFATFSWLGHREVARLRDRTGRPVPGSSEGIRSWLAATPAGPGTACARIELLTGIGQLDAAARELAALPPPETDQDRLDEAAVRQLLTFVSTGESGLDALTAVVESLRPGGEPAREGRVVMALAEARSRLAAGEADWQRPLVDAGRGLGRARWTAVIRDTGTRFLVLLTFVAGVDAGLVTLLRGGLLGG